MTEYGTGKYGHDLGLHLILGDTNRGYTARGLTFRLIVILELGLTCLHAKIHLMIEESLLICKAFIC